MAGELLGLSSKPFADETDAPIYYAAAAHERVVESLGDAIKKGCGAVLLIGERGSGKTVICRQVLKQFKATAFPILGTCTDEAKTGLIDRLCSALNVDLSVGADAEQHAKELKARIANETSLKRPGVLLVLDQIENLTDRELDELEMLCEMKTDGRHLVQMVLSGRPEAAARLAHKRLSRLQQHLGITCLLDPLTSQEIGPYINRRLSAAGRDDSDAFNSQAVSLIGKLSRGNPSTVNRLCQAALQAAEDQQQTIIDASLIEGLDLAELVPQAVPLLGSLPSVRPRASMLPAAGESTPAHQAALAAREQRARDIEERVERACARADSVAAGLETALTLGARLGVETDRHAGILEESIQQACRLQKDLAELTRVAGSDAGASDPSGDVSEAVAIASQLVAQMHQVGEEVIDHITAVQNSVVGVMEEQRDSVGSLIQQLQGAQDRASQSQDQAEQVERRVHTALAGASERENVLEKLCQRADSVGQMVKLEMNTAQETCKQVASLTSALQQARQRSVAGVVDAASTTESLIAAVTQAQAASNGIQRQLSSQVSEAQDKTRHLSDAVATAQRACDAVKEEVSATQSTVRAVADAQEAVLAVRQEIVASQDACQRIATATKGLDQTRQDAETVSSEVQSATDDLRAMLADRQTAMDAVDDRLRTTITLGEKTASQVDDKIESLQTATVQAATALQDTIGSAHRQSTALEDRIETGEQLTLACERAADLSQELADNRDRAETTAGHLDRLVSDGKSAVEAMAGAENSATALRQEIAAAQDAGLRIATLTKGLDQNRHDAETVSVEARSATDDLRAMLADSQTAVDAVDHRLRTTISVGQETASQVDDKIESLQTATVQATTALQDAIGSAHRQSTVLEDRIETGEQLHLACERAADLSQELADNRDRAETTAGHLDRLVSDGKSAVEAMAGAENSVTALRQEIAAAQDAGLRIATLTKGLDQNRHDAETVSVEARSATDDLRAMLADSQTAVDAVDHRLRTTISVGQETASQVDEKMAACGLQLSVLQEQVEVAGHAADRIGCLSETLQSETASGEEVVQASRAVLESLTHAMAEGRCEARSIGQAVEAVVAQADQTIASAAAEAEQVIDRVQLATAKVVSEGGVAADVVRQRVETVIALADQESDKIEASRTAAAQALTTLQEANASAQRQSVDLKDKVETGERLNVTCQLIGQETIERSERAESLMQQLKEVTAQAGEVAESLAESTMPAQQALRTLTDLVQEAGPVSDRLEDSTTQATRAQEHCRQETVTAGKAGVALTDLAKHATAIAQQIEKADASARAGFAKLGEQRQAARATIERQQVMRDKGLALLKQLGDQTGSAQELVQQLTDHNTGADAARAELQESIDRAAQSRFEIDGRIQAADNRKAALLVSEQTLAEFLDQAEALQQQVQRIGARADAFEVRLNQMLDRPTEIAAEAKSQAAQLQGVCRAVRKIFAGLSDAALQAKQRTDQFNQASQSANGQARRLATETSQAAETLKRWVEEAVNAQRRLAASLEQAPSVAQTHPAGSLRNLSQLADKGMERSSPLLSNNDDAVRAERMPGVLDRPTSVQADTGHVLLANRPGPIKPAASKTSSEARGRTEEVARLLEDARRVAETAG